MRALIFLLLVAVFCATMTSADQGQIKFKISGMPGNSEWNYSTTPGITVFGLKQLLQMPTNTPPAEQSLKLNGNEMIDSNTLKSYNLQENTVLNWSRNNDNANSGQSNSNSNQNKPNNPFWKPNNPFGGSGRFNNRFWNR